MQMTRLISLEQRLRYFSNFLAIYRFKTKHRIFKIARIDLLKGALEAVGGIRLVDLTVDTIKILGLHFSYDEETQIRKNFFLSQLEIY